MCTVQTGSDDAAPADAALPLLLSLRLLLSCKTLLHASSLDICTGTGIDDDDDMILQVDRASFFLPQQATAL
jgi:hypothetical protein